jgi:hypothetical protein
LKAARALGVGLAEAGMPLMRKDRRLRGILRLRLAQASYSSTIAHSCACLDDGGPFETRPQDNLKTLWLVEDCYQMTGQ